MRNTTTHTGKLEIIKRLPSSVNGNPRYLLRVDGWTCCTPVDSQIAYHVPNWDGRIVAAEIGTFRGVAMLAYARLIPDA